MRFTNLAVTPFPHTNFNWYDIRQIELPSSLKGEFCRISLEGDSNLGSFEGSSYEDLVFYTTGYSLQEDYLPPEEVREIHRGLVDHLKENKREWNEDLKRALNLEGFFRVCAKNGLGLVSLKEER